MPEHAEWFPACGRRVRLRLRSVAHCRSCGEAAGEKTLSRSGAERLVAAVHAGRLDEAQIRGRSARRGGGVGLRTCPIGDAARRGRRVITGTARRSPASLPGDPSGRGRRRRHRTGSDAVVRLGLGRGTLPPTALALILAHMLEFGPLIRTHGTRAGPTVSSRTTTARPRRVRRETGHANPPAGPRGIPRRGPARRPRYCRREQRRNGCATASTTVAASSSTAAASRLAMPPIGVAGRGHRWPCRLRSGSTLAKWAPRRAAHGPAVAATAARASPATQGRQTR